jgi:hypothetical protein
MDGIGITHWHPYRGLIFNKSLTLFSCCTSLAHLLRLQFVQWKPDKRDYSAKFLCQVGLFEIPTLRVVSGGEYSLGCFEQCRWNWVHILSYGDVLQSSSIIPHGLANGKCGEIVDDIGEELGTVTSSVIWVERGSEPISAVTVHRRIKVGSYFFYISQFPQSDTSPSTINL